VATSTSRSASTAHSWNDRRRDAEIIRALRPERMHEHASTINGNPITSKRR
jgi:hypothetical protein